MAVPNITEIIGVGMAVCRQEKLYRDTQEKRRSL